MREELRLKTFENRVLREEDILVYDGEGRGSRGLDES